MVNEGDLEKLVGRQQEGIEDPPAHLPFQCRHFHQEVLDLALAEYSVVDEVLGALSGELGQFLHAENVVLVPPDDAMVPRIEDVIVGPQDILGSQHENEAKVSASKGGTKRISNVIAIAD